MMMATTLRHLDQLLHTVERGRALNVDESGRLPVRLYGPDGQPLFTEQNPAHVKGEVTLKGHTVPDEEAIPTRNVQVRKGVLTDASYSWWVNPLAYRYTGYHDKTYFSSVSSDGNIQVASLDHDTGKVDRFVLASFESDEHNAAAVRVLPDRRVLTMYTRHNRDNLIRYRISTNPEDISAFGPEQTIEASDKVTYVQVIETRGNAPGQLHLFYRVGTTQWAYRKSTDYGATWSPEVIFLSAGSQYYIKAQLSAPIEHRIRLGLVGHPRNSPLHNIYYGYLDVRTGDIFIPGNTVIGNVADGTNLPLAPDDFFVAYTAEEGERTRLLDVAADGPAFLLASFTNHNNAVYKYCIFDSNSGEFVTRDIVAAGQPIEIPAGANYYFAGASFVIGDASTLYIIREDTGEWILEKYTTVDAGVTWDVTEITRQQRKSFRPLTPFNPHPDMPWMFVRGFYQNYEIYKTDIVWGLE